MKIEIKEVVDYSSRDTEYILLVNEEAVMTGRINEIKEKINKIIEAWF
ncbi:MAG: hypothetical protein ACOCT9_00625 [archaeon]